MYTPYSTYSESKWGLGRKCRSPRTRGLFSRNSHSTQSPTTTHSFATSSLHTSLEPCDPPATRDYHVAQSSPQPGHTARPSAPYHANNPHLEPSAQHSLAVQFHKQPHQSQTLTTHKNAPSASHHYPPSSPPPQTATAATTPPQSAS
jgi:hypothetical protein